MFWHEDVWQVGRVATENQIAAHFFQAAANPVAAARQAIRKQLIRKQVTISWAMLHPVLDLKEQGPVLEWKPGESTPDFGRIAWQLKSRWKLSPVRTKLVFPSDKGRPFRRPRATELLHDTHVTELFFALQRPQNYIAEDSLSRTIWPFSFRPDALLRGTKSLLTCLEFGGTYQKPKLLQMHQNYRRFQIPYQIY